MKFNLKGLNLNMLLLVVILVGVLVVILRQNNKCMMDEDVEEVFNLLGFKRVNNKRIKKNKRKAPFGRQIAGFNLTTALNNCYDMHDCFGVQETQNVINVGPSYSFVKGDKKMIAGPSYTFVKGDKKKIEDDRRKFKDNFDQYFEARKNDHFYKKF